MMSVVRPSLRLFLTSVATLALVYSTTTRAQEATMATIKGEGEYTISGSTECSDEATSTIKPGERFIAVELSYGKKDWAVYLSSGVTGTIPRNRIRVLPDEPLTKLNFAGCKEKWRKLQSKRIEMTDDTASSAKSRGVVNYYKTLLKASEGDVTAFAQFNSLTPFMDGAGAEGHSWYKWVLLHVAGDDTFAKLLSRESSKVREQYATHFSSYSDTDPISNPKPYIKLHFPKTYSILYGEKANQVKQK
jgi:hypothetical protein